MQQSLSFYRPPATGQRRGIESIGNKFVPEREGQDGGMSYFNVVKIQGSTGMKKSLEVLDSCEI